MDNQETVQAAIDSLRQDVEGLRDILHVKDTTMEFLLARLDKAENELAATEQRMDDLLLGSIATFAMPEPPQGWLVCDGQKVSRYTYSLLFAKIGTTFGEGDGEETFNLPDLRGVFLRGWDEEREFGSHQDDQMQGHTHRDGGHSHYGGTHSTGSHTHDGKSGTDGSHSHSGKTSEGGWHYHNFPKKGGDDSFHAIGFYSKYFHERQKNQGTEPGKILGTYNDYIKGERSWHNQYSNCVTYTASNGSHIHTLSTDSAGYHTHSLEINSAGSHSHSFTTTSSSASIGAPVSLSHGTPRCGDETRPANVALLFCIKY